MDRMRWIQKSSDHTLGGGAARDGIDVPCPSMRGGQRRSNLNLKDGRLLRSARNDGRVGRRGTTIVEAAFVLPLLLLVVLGAIEYGWLFYNIQQVTNAARQAARIAILPGRSAADVKNNVIMPLLKQAHLDNDSPTVNISPPALIPGDPDGRKEITVQITVSTAKLHIVNMDAFALPGTHLEPPTIGATVTMAMEGSYP